MCRHLHWLLPAVVILSYGLVGCSEHDATSSLPDRPFLSDTKMAHVLYDYLADKYNFAHFWATPTFFVDEKWSASYQGEGKWLVKAYDVGYNGPYIGSWLVPEDAYFDKDYKVITPFDDQAKSVTSGARRIAEMPPRPSFLRMSNSPREDLIRAAQQYIVSMSAQKAEENLLTEIQKAIRSYYPLEWQVEYTDSIWVLSANYFEYRVSVQIDPMTGTVLADGMPR